MLEIRPSVPIPGEKVVRLKNRSAFTLVEIMVVVGIIALLAALVMPNLVRTRKAGNEAAALAALKAISSALETYVIQNDRYPVDVTALTAASPPYLHKNFFGGPLHGFT